MFFQKNKVILGVIITVLCGNTSYAANDVPVKIGGDAEYDACYGNGVVNGLDPNGTGFLIVRSGPGSRFRKIDEIPNGQIIMYCAESKKWTGVVFSKKENVDCQVSSPVAKRRPYSGPCQSGWVKTKYLKGTAG